MSEMARVIRPMQITPDNLVSSNVAEDDYPAWLVGTAYAVDAWVIDDHFVYQAAAANTGKKPADSPTIWAKKGATNRWLMFDNKVGTQTVRVDGIDVVVEQDEFV